MAAAAAASASDRGDGLGLQAEGGRRRKWTAGREREREGAADGFLQVWGRNMGDGRGAPVALGWNFQFPN
jgi:hypothetical protein